MNTIKEYRTFLKSVCGMRDADHHWAGKRCSEVYSHPVPSRLLRRGNLGTWKAASFVLSSPLLSNGQCLLVPPHLPPAPRGVLRL